LIRIDTGNNQFRCSKHQFRHHSTKQTSPVATSRGDDVNTLVSINNKFCTSLKLATNDNLCAALAKTIDNTALQSARLSSNDGPCECKQTTRSMSNLKRVTKVKLFVVELPKGNDLEEANFSTLQSSLQSAQTAFPQGRKQNLPHL
jgi:hypothetical protein